MNARTLLPLAALVLCGGASAQKTGFYSDGRPELIFNPVSGLDRTDVSFLNQAAAANRFEIEAAKIAQQNTTDPFVLEFAKEMVTDHTACQEELKQTAAEKNVSLDMPLPKMLDSMLNKLRSMHAGSFDHLYLSINKTGHEEAIHLYKHEINDGHDQLVKAFAVKTLPTVELHFKMLINGKTEMGESKAEHGM